MAGRPKYTKPDANQAEIVAQLRELGYDVDIVCNLPGLYDLVVSGVRLDGAKRMLDVVGLRVEIKQPGERLNANEESYWEKQNHRRNLIIAESVEDILK